MLLGALPIGGLPIGSPPKIYVIAGVTRNASNAPLAGCNVYLFLTATNVLIASTVSDSGGNYSFVFDEPYGANFFIVSYLPGSPDVFGTTLNTLSPS